VAKVFVSQPATLSTSVGFAVFGAPPAASAPPVIEPPVEFEPPLLVPGLLPLVLLAPATEPGLIVLVPPALTPTASVPPAAFGSPARFVPLPGGTLLLAAARKITLSNAQVIALNLGKICASVKTHWAKSPAPSAL
jgi:hypothetical protein